LAHRKSMRLSNPAVNLQKLGKYTISGFAKSAIADYYATLCVFAMLSPANAYEEKRLSDA